jgi:hypothetical protein
VDNTALYSATATADAGGAQQLAGTTGADGNGTPSQAAFDADYTVTYMYKDSNGNVAAPVTRRVVVVDTVAPTLELTGDCVIQNSAGAHYNSTAAQGTIAESQLSGTNGLFDHDRIARFFSHRDDCDRKVHTVVTLHTGGCNWAATATGGVVTGNTNCHGTASGAKLGCAGSDDDANSKCYLGVFQWNGDEDETSAASDTTFTDMMGATKNTFHQEFHEYIAGEYAVQYKTQDASGHFVTACRKIQNVDHTYPIIQILGSDQMTLEATHQGNYIDDGATCSDQVDGVISQNVEVSGDVVNLSKVGTYRITYNCKDAANRAAETAERVVTVAQTSCPTCNMVCATGATANSEVDGDQTVVSCVQEHEASFQYTDAGAACSDVIDGATDHTCTLSFVPGTENKEDNSRTEVAALAGDRVSCDGQLVNADRIGTYVITYRSVNSVGKYNDDTTCRGGYYNYIRSVQVVDTLKPVITLKYGSDIVAQGPVEDSENAKGFGSSINDAGTNHGGNHKGTVNTPDSLIQDQADFSKQTETLMAEDATTSGVNGWVLGAIASAVTGLALLGYSQRKTTVATSVPV